MFEILCDFVHKDITIKFLAAFCMITAIYFTFKVMNIVWKLTKS